jgi:glycosyltransferase involved in cell wall biosynthesis
MNSAGERRRRIFVDVSVLARSDARTGIQRVVRSIWLELISTGHCNFEIVPVAAAKRGPYRRIRSNFLDHPIKTMPWPLGGARIDARRDDVFFGLDLSAHLAPQKHRCFMSWRKQGMKIIHVVYDILPLQRPEWFNSKSHEIFSRWVDHVISTSDVVLCISKSVAHEFSALVGEKRYANKNGPNREPLVKHMRIEGTIAASNPSQGLPDDANDTLKWMATSQTVLMVGTVEPRKGYEQALEALDIFSSESSPNAPQLVIVGKPGWKTRELQEKLLKSSSDSKRLRWISDASDEYLELLYRACTGLLVASHGEGLGLPLLEAMEHGKPILARDLPVFREVAPTARFFVAETPLELAKAVESWLSNAHAQPPAQDHGRGWNTAVDDLMEAIKTLSDRPKMQ